MVRNATNYGIWITIICETVLQLRSISDGSKTISLCGIVRFVQSWSDVKGFSIKTCLAENSVSLSVDLTWFRISLREFVVDAFSRTCRGAIVAMGCMRRVITLENYFFDFPVAVDCQNCSTESFGTPWCFFLFKLQLLMETPAVTW